ncbi:MAG TPA: NAD(P)-dependent oxidoreductase [Candidatus Saccharibacteria bacterium]|nr:NAD(P)-dependent oxidoreductase [Candidatus Saccharibacteria bacterium]
MKAFIFDPLWDELVTAEMLAQLKEAGLDLVITKTIAPLSDCKDLYSGDEERILCLNPDYVGWKLDSSDYEDIPNLRAILGAATSFSWVDTTVADTKKIPVCNIRNFSTEAVSEWALTMLFNLARQTPRLIKDGFPLDFDKDFMKYRGIELKGKKVGIIGLGHIGSAIAERCEGLGMNVTYWSKSPKKTIHKHVELTELFRDSDVIFPTMALNDETKKIITDDLLESMKKSAILVSIVHEMFSQELVLDMVKRNKLFGFGFEAEPKTFGNYEGNVWAAPAYGWVTDGSMKNSMVAWIENIINASKGNFPNKVN